LKKLEILSQQFSEILNATSANKLSAFQANEILETTQQKDELFFIGQNNDDEVKSLDATIRKEIEVLSWMETAVQQTVTEFQTCHKEVITTKTFVEGALDQEDMALRRLEDATMELIKAQQRISLCRMDHSQVIQK